ncbi:hypothetical protein SBOR_8780 [Sclerotinia borealis F-4128]|uniref:Uncharacterized protein n=1 Tax=Sclerotinia borealis (strain F-4128) TaxID=1432307 RepID=W9C8G9_SCLBF|nr:hypothetical protein SBOR_8780 [Sclerotinia borealis F-4128]
MASQPPHKTNRLPATRTQWKTDVKNLNNAGIFDVDKEPKKRSFQIRKRPTPLGAPSKNMDTNQTSLDINKYTSYRLWLQTRNTKSKEDLELLEQAWTEVIRDLSVGKVWKSMSTEQKSAFDRAIRSRVSYLEPNPDRYWSRIHEFAARIFFVTKELKAVVDSTEMADLGAILRKASSSRILPREECRKIVFRPFDVDKERMQKLDCEGASGKVKVLDMPAPGSNTIQKTSEDIKHIHNIRPDIPRQKKELENVLASMDGTAKVVQEPRNLRGPKIAPEVTQDLTHKKIRLADAITFNPRLMLNGQLCERLSLTPKSNSITPGPVNNDSHCINDMGTSKSLRFQKDPDLFTLETDKNISDLSSYRNYLNTKLLQHRAAPKVQYASLSDETQSVLDKARQTTTSVRDSLAANREQEQQRHFDDSSNLTIRQDRQATMTTLYDRAEAITSRACHLLKDARAREVLCQLMSPKTRLRTYLSENEQRTRARAERFDDIAAQRLEKWGYSKADASETAKHSTSPPSPPTVANQQVSSENDQKPTKVINTEVAAADKSNIEDSSAINNTTHTDSKTQRNTNDTLRVALNEFNHVETKGFTEFSIGLLKKSLPKVSPPQEVGDNDVMSEDEWIMAEDEAEDWEIV